MVRGDARGKGCMKNVENNQLHHHLVTSKSLVMARADDVYCTEI